MPNQTFFEGLETCGERMVKDQMARCERKRLLAQTKQANEQLYKLGHNVYHDSIPLDVIDAILSRYDFDPLEPMILCGRSGQIHESIGRNRWLSLSWYKMESGRYEVIAYVS